MGRQDRAVVPEPAHPSPATQAHRAQSAESNLQPDGPSANPPLVGSQARLLNASLGSFSESLDALRATCTILERKCTNLNWALEKANRKLKDSLAERERLASRLDGILRCLSVGVIAVDLEGRLIEFNEAAESITGYAKRKVLGTPYAEIVGRGLGESMGPLHTMETGVRVEHREKVITTANGECIPVGFSTSLVKGEGGEILGAVEVFDDLRSAKLAEEELLRTRTLAAVGEMAAEVARQVRNPLAGLAGFTELLARDLAGDPRWDPLVCKIQMGVAAVESAVARLVESARPMQADFQSTNLGAVLERVLDVFERSLEPEERIALARDIRCPHARARLDEEQIRQVLWNLLTNAREAMPSGGRVSVTLEKAGQDAPGNVAGRESTEGTGPRPSVAPFLAVSVTDTGEGMPPDVAESAFAPFFTTKARAAGLGLTAVRRIITAHGGDVSLASGAEGGTRVTFRLPSEPELRRRNDGKEDTCQAPATRNAS